MGYGDASAVHGLTAPTRQLVDCLRSVDATPPAGLSSTEAAGRLRRVGPNALTPPAGTLPLAVLANQFRSPLVLILLAAAGLSFALGEIDEALIVACIVLASSGLGFYQEYRAASTVDALGRRLAVKAKVLRDGPPREIATTGLVPGDVIMLAGGSLIPADAVLLEAQDLHVEEAALTGESFPAVKVAALSDLPLTDENMVRMGAHRCAAGQR